MDVAVDGEEGVVGLDVAVDVEAADVEVGVGVGATAAAAGEGGGGGGLEVVPGGDEGGGLVEGVHFVGVPEAGRVGEGDGFVGELF